MLASRERRDINVALTSTVHWFETDVLAEERNYKGLGPFNTVLIERAATRSPTRRVILDIDSSESPVHGAQARSDVTMLKSARVQHSQRRPRPAQRAHATPGDQGGQTRIARWP